MADETPSPEATELMAEAERLQARLADTARQLRNAETALRGLGLSRRNTDEEFQRDLADLTQRHQVELLGEADRQGLRSVIEVALKNRDPEAPEPDIGDYARLINLNQEIREAAGQPVMVIRPAESRVDIARLAESDGEHPIGLRAAHRRHQGRVIELPTWLGAGYLSLDYQTGLRQQGPPLGYVPIGDSIPSRPILSDPFMTYLVENRAAIPADELPEAAAFIVTGYENLRDELNRCLAAQETSRDEFPIKRFLWLERTLEDLAKTGVEFDPDFVDGHLDWRIAELRETAGADRYRRDVLATLEAKRAQLIAAGWLAE